MKFDEKFLYDNPEIARLAKEVGRLSSITNSVQLFLLLCATGGRNVLVNDKARKMFSFIDDMQFYKRQHNEMRAEIVKMANSIENLCGRIKSLEFKASK